jgi:hypothetical protein
LGDHVIVKLHLIKENGGSISDRNNSAMDNLAHTNVNITIDLSISAFDFE